MLWVKAFHIIFVVCWFAGLFYLPRLFVYHASTEDEISNARFKIMEKKLYYGIMMPSMILTLISGGWLLVHIPVVYFHTGWLPLKLALVFLLIIYHFYCSHLVKVFKNDRNTHSHVFYRWLNELPTLALIAIVILAVVRPF